MCGTQTLLCVPCHVQSVQTQEGLSGHKDRVSKSIFCNYIFLPFCFFPWPKCNTSVSVLMGLLKQFLSLSYLQCQAELSSFSLKASFP